MLQLILSVVAVGIFKFVANFPPIILLSITIILHQILSVYQLVWKLTLGYYKMNSPNRTFTWKCLYANKQPTNLHNFGNVVCRTGCVDSKSFRLLKVHVCKNRIELPRIVDLVFWVEYLLLRNATSLHFPSSTKNKGHSSENFSTLLLF